MQILVHLQLLHVHPAGIVAGGGAVAVKTEFGADPGFRFGRERRAGGGEAFSVGREAELADGIRHIPFHRPGRHLQLDPQDSLLPVRIHYRRNIAGGVGKGMGRSLVRQDAEVGDGFRRPLGSLEAHGKLQPGAGLGVCEAERGVVVAHDDESGLFAFSGQLRIGMEAEPGRDGETRRREFLQQQVEAVPQIGFGLVLGNGIEPQRPIRQGNRIH